MGAKVRLKVRHNFFGETTMKIQPSAIELAQAQINNASVGKFDYLLKQEFLNLLVQAQTHTEKYVNDFNEMHVDLGGNSPVSVNFDELVNFVLWYGRFPKFAESCDTGFCVDITMYEFLESENFFIFAPKRDTQNGAEICDKLAELRSELSRVENQLAELRQDNFRFYRDGYNRHDMYLVDYCDELHVEIDNLEHDEDYIAFLEMDNWGFTN